MSVDRAPGRTCLVLWLGVFVIGAGLLLGLQAPEVSRAARVVGTGLLVVQVCLALAVTVELLRLMLSVPAPPPERARE